MKLNKMLTAAAVLLLSLHSFALLAQQNAIVKPNTVVPIRIMTQVNSQDFNPVQAIVDQAVTDTAGKVLIAPGTEVMLQVVKEKARGVGRPGKIALEPLQVPTTDGRIAKLQGMATFIGEDRKDVVTLATVGGCLFFGPPGLLLLLIKGKPAFVPAGYLLTNIVIKTVE